jgi:hypothetical protein
VGVVQDEVCTVANLILTLREQGVPRLRCIEEVVDCIAVLLKWADVAVVEWNTLDMVMLVDCKWSIDVREDERSALGFSIAMVNDNSPELVDVLAKAGMLSRSGSLDVVLCDVVFVGGLQVRRLTFRPGFGWWLLGVVPVLWFSWTVLASTLSIFVKSFRMVVWSTRGFLALVLWTLSVCIKLFLLMCLNARGSMGPRIGSGRLELGSDGFFGRGSHDLSVSLRCWWLWAGLL